MGTFKKAKVILLPTGFIARRNEIGLQAYKTNLRIINNTEEENLIFNQQHLYIISDDKIKGGDWFYNIHSKIVGRAAFNFGKDELAKKIIATTDNSLGFSFKVNHGVSTTTAFTPLPQPPQQFIQKYIEEYNKGNVITDVLVEELRSSDGYYDEQDIWHWRTLGLKINPKDNTITIKKVKDSWNREEVIKLLRDAHLDIVDGNYSKGLNKWIEENL